MHFSLSWAAHILRAVPSPHRRAPRPPDLRSGQHGREGADGWSALPTDVNDDDLSLAATPVRLLVLSYPRVIPYPRETEQSLDLEACKSMVCFQYSLLSSLHCYIDSPGWLRLSPVSKIPVVSPAHLGSHDIPLGRMRQRYYDQLPVNGEIPTKNRPLLYPLPGIRYGRLI